MPLFYKYGLEKKLDIQRDFIGTHERVNEQRGDISADAEYKNLVGEELKKNRQRTGHYTVGSKYMRTADVIAAERMYAAGYSKSEVMNSVMKHSPMTKGMLPIQKQMYKAKLNRAMRKVEPLQKQIAQSKELHGVSTNRVKDINDYAKIVNKHQHSKNEGLQVNKPSFKEFKAADDKSYHHKYADKVDRAIIKNRESKQRTPEQVAKAKPRLQQKPPVQQQQQKRSRKR